MTGATACRRTGLYETWSGNWTVGVSWPLCLSSALLLSPSVLAEMNLADPGKVPATTSTTPPPQFFPYSVLAPDSVKTGRVSDWRVCAPPRAQRPSRTPWSVCGGHFLHEANQPELRVSKRNLPPGGASLLCCFSENSSQVSQ